MQKQGFRRILLATDGSDQAATAVGVTSWLAKASSAQVRVIHVWNMDVRRRDGTWDIEMRNEAERLIDEAVERMHAAGVAAQGEIRRSDSKHVALAVATAAREFHADLVVVGSRGLSDWKSMFQGSISHELLSAVDSPLLIVRGRTADGHHAKRVLLAIAGGDDVAPGVRVASAAAAAPGSEVLVVHVAQAIVSAGGFAYVEPDEEIAATMKQATALLAGAGVEAQEMVARSGPVAEVVAEVAAGWHADVIVLGSSRMGDLASLVFGSVTHSLLRATDKPVLVAERARR
jgi:nucleotide-binding universal stress UspA family protein